MENENALKHLYDRALLKRMGTSLKKAYPKFDQVALNALFKNFGELEMKPRVRAIRDELKRQLPQDFPRALAILMKSVKAGDLSSFDYWPYAEFIQTYGLDTPDVALEAMQELTPEFTSEWAIRPYLTRYEKQSLRFLEKATKHPRKSVRRWASEGSRPRLPWGERLNAFAKDPTKTAKILEALKFDEELFVRKSVANHLNDIAKDHPDYVVSILAKWKSQAPEKHRAKVDWITRHALRTLIKAGHSGALKLIGVSTSVRLEITNFTLKPSTLHFGDSLEFNFDLELKEKNAQKVVVDYIIDFVKSNGKTAPKVFKLKTLSLVPREAISVRKAHAVRKITTREYFPGKHTLSIQVNGKIIAKKDWHLKIN